eukprot:11234781-Alexandrium_andersonii.AAC.1
MVLHRFGTRCIAFVVPPSDNCPKTHSIPHSQDCPRAYLPSSRVGKRVFWSPAQVLCDSPYV